MAYVRKVLEGKQPAIRDSPGARSIDEIAPRHGPSSIEFRNVTFRYNEEGIEPGMEAEVPSVLRGISFRVLPGQNVALVGPSGSGKSTTLKLITRMLEPATGEVLIDGCDVRNVTIESLRKRIAVVPQDTCLFDETIDYNIRYGNPNATHQEIEAAIAQANLRPTIEKFPLGLETNVGERGARLSGGERQKVSIAR
jgi:ABC-type multidrug transport system fused ATPase/permease subunit